MNYRPDIQAAPTQDADRHSADRPFMSSALLIGTTITLTEAGLALGYNPVTTAPSAEQVAVAPAVQQTELGNRQAIEISSSTYSTYTPFVESGVDIGPCIVLAGLLATVLVSASSKYHRRKSRKADHKQ